MKVDGRISIAHGAGGLHMHKLIKEHILPRFKQRRNVEIPLTLLADSAVVDGIAFTTDSYTVKPLFFPGGDIGRLSIFGTVNDLSVIGSEPLAISCALVIEEGFEIEKLDRILSSMDEAAEEAGVEVVTGDTKVVERGKLDEMIINTAGIGRKNPHLDRNLEKAASDGRSLISRWLDPRNIRPGDRLIVSGPIGEHAMTIIAARGELGFEAPSLRSDTAPLNHIIERVLEVGGVLAAKDPTRGGLAALLNEWSEATGLGILVKEAMIPVREEVRIGCEILGIDPLELACEGRVVLAVSEKFAEDVLEVLRSHPLGREAEIIGWFSDEHEGVIVETVIGGLRYLPMPLGDPIPRIC